MPQTPVTFFSKGGAAGPDELTDPNTEKGYSALGPNLMEGAAAVGSRAALGTIYRDDTTKQVFIATDLHGNRDKSVIDLYKEPENYVRDRQMRNITVVGKMPVSQVGRDRNKFGAQIMALQEQEFPGSMMSDEEATAEMDRIEKMPEGPEREAAKIKLGNWVDARAINRKKEEINLAVDGYEDIEQVPWTPADEDYANEAGLDSYQERARRQNISYLSAISGRDRSEVEDNLDMLRPWLADSIGIKDPEKVDDLQIFRAAEAKVKERNQKRENLGEVINTGMFNLVNSTIDQKHVDSEAAFVAAGGDPSDKGQAAAFNQVYEQAQSFVESHADLIRDARDIIGSQTGLEDHETNQKLGDLVDKLNALPEDKQNEALGYLVAYFKSQGKDKNYFLQVSESVGRGFGGFFNDQTRKADERKMARVERQLVGGSGQPLMWNPAQGYGSIISRDEYDASQINLEGYESFPVSELGQDALDTVRRLKKASNVARKLSKIVEYEIDPIKILSSNPLLAFLEQGTYDAAGSLAYLGIGMIPIIGQGLTVNAMIAGTYEDLRLTYPDMPLDQANAVALASGTLQGIIEITQAGQIFHRLPFFRQAMHSPNFIARWGEQFAEESAQTVIDFAVRSVSKEMGAVMPGFDWWQEMKGLPGEFGQNAGATLFFALPGRYRGLLGTKSRFQRVLDKGDREALGKLGFEVEQVDRILSVPAGEARNFAAQEEYSKRPAEAVAQAFERANAEVKAESELTELARAANEEIPEIIQIKPDVFGLRYPDGREVEIGGHEEAYNTLRREVKNYLRQGIWENQALMRFFQERLPDADWQAMPEAELLNRFLEEGLATQEQIDTRIRLAGLPEGSVAEVDGYTKSELIDGVIKHTIALVEDARPETVIEEAAHTAYRNALLHGQLKYADAVDAVRKYGRRVTEFSLDNPSLTKEQIRTIVDEGIADMVKSHFFGGLREMDRLIPGVRGFIAKMARMMREVFRRAYIVKKMLREGEISQDVQTFLAQAAGMQAPPVYNQQSLDVVNYIRGTGQRPLAFSLRANERAKTDSAMDSSRVGTAKNLKGATSQSANITGKIVPKDVLEKQMAQISGPAFSHLPKSILDEPDAARKRSKLVRWMRENLVALYDLFPEDIRNRATHWYDGAHRLARGLSNRWEISIEQAAALYAVHSPQKDWFQNIALAEQTAEVWFRHRDRTLTRELVGDAIERIINGASLSVSIMKGKSAQEKSALLKAHKAEVRKKLETILGKTIEDLDEISQAMAIRVMAMTQFGTYYNIVTPEGDKIGRATTKSGSLASLTWGNYDTIIKSVSILKDGSLSNISNKLGNKHKVRNFYNNIVAPNSPRKDVTSDTHHVAASHLLPLGGSSPIVLMNLGTGAGSLTKGISGNYHLYADAARDAAAHLTKRDGKEVQPRQVQSVTWETIRLLFEDWEKRNAGFVQQIYDIWKTSKSATDARKQILSRKKLPSPDWHGSGGYRGSGDYAQAARTVAGQETQPGGSGAVRDIGTTVGAGIAFSIQPSARDQIRVPDIEELSQEFEQYGADPEERAARNARAQKALHRIRDMRKYAKAGLSPQVAQLQFAGVLDAVVASLPARARGHFPTSYFAKLQELAPHNRDDFIKHAIAKTDDLLEKDLQADYTERVDNFFDRYKPKSLEKTKAGFAQDYVNMARQAWSRDAAESQAELKKLDSIASDPDATAEQINDAYRRIAIESMYGGHEKMNAQTLVEAWNRLQATRKEGVEAWRNSEQARIDEQERLAGIGVDKLGMATEHDVQESHELENTFKRHLSRWAADHNTLPQALSWFFGESSDLVRHFHRRLFKANAEAEEAQADARVKMGQTIGDAIGTQYRSIKGKLAVSAETRRLAQRHDRNLIMLEGRKTEKLSVSIEDANAIARGFVPGHGYSTDEVTQMQEQLDLLPSDTRRRTIQIERVIEPGRVTKFPKLSLSNAVYLVMTWAQEDGKIKLQEQGISEDVIINLENWVAGDAAARAVLGFLRKEYDAGYARINRVFRRIYGFSLPKVDFYSPLRIDRAGAKNLEMSMEGDFVGNGVTPGALHTRTPNTQPIDLHSDALSVYHQHAARTTYWMAYAETIRELRAVFSNRELTKSIKARFGEKNYRKLHDQINMVAANGLMHAGGIEAESAIGRIYGARALTVLGTSIRTVVMQSDNFLRFLWTVPEPSRWARALGDFARNPGEFKKILHSPGLQARIINGFSPEVRSTLSRANVDPTRLTDLAEIGLLPMQMYDVWGSTFFATITYKDARLEALKEGRSAEEAHQSGLDAVDAALFSYAQPTSVAQRSLVEQKGPIHKLLFQFATDMRQKTANYLGFWRKLLFTAETPKEKRIALLQIIYSHLLWVVGEGLADFIKAATGDDDEDWFDPLDYVRATIAGPLDGIFVVGSALNLGVSKALGIFSWNNTQNPLAQEVDNIYKMINHIDDFGDFEHPDEAIEAWKRAMRSAAALSAGAGLPTISAGAAIGAQATRALEDALKFKDNVYDSTDH